MYERRGKPLANVIKVNGGRKSTEPLLWSLRYVRWANAAFKAVTGKDSVAAFSERIREVLAGWLLDLVPGVDFNEVYWPAEFVLDLALIAGPGSSRDDGPRVPMGGLYLYEWEAQQTIGNWLATKPEWLQELVAPRMLKDALEAFDSTVRQAVSVEMAFPYGFTGGAVDSWDGNPPRR